MRSHVIVVPGLGKGSGVDASRRLVNIMSNVLDMPHNVPPVMGGKQIQRGLPCMSCLHCISVRTI